MVEYGLTEAEFYCFVESTLKDCDLQAKQRDSVPSSKVVGLIMDMAMLRYADPLVATTYCSLLQLRYLP